MHKASFRTARALVVCIGVLACRDDTFDPATEFGGGAGQASVAQSPANLDAIQDIVETFDRTWGNDAVTYASQYAGADWVGPNGAVITDPGALIGLYSFLFSTIFAGTTRQSTIRNLTFLTGTIAVLDIDTRVTGFGALPPGVVPWQPGIIRALEKDVLIKRGGEWQIVQHQQTVVAPVVP